jgi:hypothetical protein
LFDDASNILAGNPPMLANHELLYQSVVNMLFGEHTNSLSNTIRNRDIS